MVPAPVNAATFLIPAVTLKVFVLLMLMWMLGLEESVKGSPNPEAVRTGEPGKLVRRIVAPGATETEAGAKSTVPLVKVMLPCEPMEKRSSPA